MSSSQHQTKSMIASGATAGVEFAAFWVCALTWGGAALAAARWGIGAAGAALGFALNRRFAFGERAEPKRAQGARYAVVSLTAVTLATGLFAVLGRAVSLDPRWLHAVSTLLVWRGYTFPLMRRWVFREAAPGWGATCR